MMKNDTTLEILKIAVRELSSMKDEIVYLGGATISLFITEPEAVSLRETFDVDCVVEVVHRQDYENVAQRLRKLGFKEDMESKILCRFKKGALTVDMMPTEAKILGFTNIWYKNGFKDAVEMKVANQTIRVISLPYLIATKLEAFKGRGKNQYLTSHDIEDIITLFDGRETIAHDLAAGPKEVVKYLANELGRLAADPDFETALDGHISDRRNIEGRKKLVMARVNEFLKHS